MGSEALVEAVDKFLGDPSFKEVAMKLKEENERMDAFGSIEKTLWEYVE